MGIKDRLREAINPDKQEAGGKVRAVWNGQVIAESDSTVIVEGNHYFPPESLNPEHLEATDQTSVCPWKGTAGYYDIAVDGEVNGAAAWHYPEPKKAAAEIEGHVAFWKGVVIEPAT